VAWGSSSTMDGLAGFRVSNIVADATKSA
jgi:hypothetical protein